MTISTSSYCILVPNYNHGKYFAQFLAQLLEYGLPVIVIDDGSDTPVSELIGQLATTHALVSAIHLPVNQGKGAAVMAGMAEAERRGFTHALQIDADGQHNPADIAAFLDTSRAQPEAVINGCPVYDDTVPKARKYGRYLTHVWVYIETLSFAIRDSMCGFRVYPLQRIMPIVSAHRIGKRMDFDTEILVRAYWAGIAVSNLDTRVIYPEDGTSTFRLWRDNWLISKMHTRLFFGMVPRLPTLIGRKFSSSANTQHWSSIQERGSVTGMRILVWVYQTLGRFPFLLFLHPIMLYFMLTARQARQASRQYLEQLSVSATENDGPAVAVNSLSVYRHFYHFANSALDKIACWTGRITRSDVIVHHEDAFQAILSSGKGAVLIGSHLGNLEVSRALGEKGGRFNINALVFNRHAAKFHEVLSRNNPSANLNLLHVDSIGADTAIILKQKVDAGEIVIIVGDRTPVNNPGRVQFKDFLGKPAPFSEGPFVLASVLACPVYLLFCIKQQGVYNIYLEHFAETLKYPRESRKEMLGLRMQDYANRLSFYCRKAPLEWFNFYDFWDEAKRDDAQAPVTQNR